MKEKQETKELIYKDARLLERLFNNIGFNLHECGLTQEERDDVSKFKKHLERDLIENILKIVRPHTHIEIKEHADHPDFKKTKRGHA